MLVDINVVPPPPPTADNTLVQNISGTPNVTNPFALDLSWQPPPGLAGVNASYYVNYTLVDSSFGVGDALMDVQMSTTDSPVLRLAELFPNSTYGISVMANYSEGDATVISSSSSMNVSTGGLSQDLFPSVPGMPMHAFTVADNTTVTVSWMTPNVAELSDMLLTGYQVHAFNSSRVGNQQSRASTRLLVSVDRNTNSTTLSNLAFYSRYTYDVRPVYSFMGVNLYAIPGTEGTFNTGEGGGWWVG